MKLLPHRALSAAALLAFVAGACGDDDDGMGGAGAAGGRGGAGAGGGGASGSVMLTTSAGGSLPQMFSVSGTVVDQAGAPVPGAMVMQGGGEVQLETGADGAFEIEMTQSLPGTPTLVAAKVGYRAAGVEIFALQEEPLVLVLYAVEAPDNAGGYRFGHPGVGDATVDISTQYCGHCHTTFAKQFNSSAHARAARDPFVQDLYAGVAPLSEAECEARGGVMKSGAVPGDPQSAQSRCYLGFGVLPDLNPGCGTASKGCDDPSLTGADEPDRFGACADCHGFGMDGPAGGRDLLEAEGIGYQFGVHCDACHHVRDVDLEAPPGGAGRLVMQRPREHLDTPGSPLRQAMFGPLPDVPNPFMGGSYQPKFSSADFCAGCHEQSQAALVPGSSLAPRFASGLPTHSTYTEWSEGPFAEAGVPCQGCHMPVIEGMFNSLDVATPDSAGLTFGFQRTAERTRSHSFRGPLTEVPGMPRLLDGAVAVDVFYTAEAGTLSLDVDLTNVACGHAVPTGEPMRSLIMLVRVRGCGEDFDPTGGLTVPEGAGSLARGVAGAEVTFAGSTITWPAASSLAALGLSVRVVRPTATYWDYPGIGLFEGTTLTPLEKGIAIDAPVGEASIISVAGDQIGLSRALAVAPGDVVLLVDPLPEAFADGDTSGAFAGAPGMVFERVMMDAAGENHVPHHRAVDIASDNRLAPQVTTTTQHRFAIPDGCTEAEVEVAVLYRPLPLGQSRQRNWDARDYVVDDHMHHVLIRP